MIISTLYHFHPELYRVLEAYPSFYERIRRWSEADDTLPPHTVLQRLEGTEIDLRKVMSDRKGSAPPASAGGTASPTPEPMLENAFADPAEGNVFRIQKLIRELGPVPVSTVERYLVR